MKKNTFLFFSFLAIIWGHKFENCSAQGAAINPTGATADSSAILDVNTTTQRILIPRLTGSGWYMLEYNVPSITGQPVAQTICEGNNTSFSITATGAGLTYQWQLSTDGGSTWTNQANGGVYSNMTTATMNITAASAGMNAYQYHCVVSGTYTLAAISDAATLTVNPLPDITATPSLQTICSGATTDIALTSDVTETVFAWTVAQSGVAGATDGSGSSIAQTLTNSGTSAGTATYAVTPTANTCSGTSTDVVITVNPLPDVTATPSSQAICSGSATGITLTSNITGTTFAWTVAQSEVTGASDGSGSSIAQTLTNTGTSTGTAIYAITSTASGCSGTSTNVVITVNPNVTALSLPTMVETFTTVDTTTWACPAGVTSVEYLVVAGGGGGGGSYYAGGGGAGGLLTATGFAVSDSLTIIVGAGGSGAVGLGTVGGHGGSSSFSTITSVGGGGGGAWSSASGADGGSGGGGSLYTASTFGTGTVGQGNNGGLGTGYPGCGDAGGAGGGGGAGGAGGNSSASESAGAGGAGIELSITGTSTYYAGGGGGAAYKNTTKGLGGSGIGGNGAGALNSPVATNGAANTGSGGGGSYDGTGGSGGSGIVVIKYMQPMSSQTICSGTATNVALTSNVSGAAFAWTVIQNGVTGASDGTGSSIAQTLTNSGTTAGTATYLITPTANTCTGTSTNVVITVNPTPQGSLAGNAVCSGGTGQFTYTSTSGTSPFTLIISGTTYSGVVSGTPFNASNPTSTTTVYTLTSITDANGCVRITGITGASATITVPTCNGTCQACQSGVCGVSPYLVNNAHCEIQCTAAGGTVVGDGSGNNMCRFDVATCPLGWTRFGLWSTTTAPTVTHEQYTAVLDATSGICAGATNSESPGNIVLTVATSKAVTGAFHSWQDLALEPTSTATWNSYELSGEKPCVLVRLTYTGLWSPCPCDAEHPVGTTYCCPQPPNACWCDGYLWGGVTGLTAWGLTGTISSTPVITQIGCY